MFIRLSYRRSSLLFFSLPSIQKMNAGNQYPPAMGIRSQLVSNWELCDSVEQDCNISEYIFFHFLLSLPQSIRDSAEWLGCWWLILCVNCIALSMLNQWCQTQWFYLLSPEASKLCADRPTKYRIVLKSRQDQAAPNTMCEWKRMCLPVHRCNDLGHWLNPSWPPCDRACRQWFSASVVIVKTP